MAVLERASGLIRANVRLTWQVTWLPQDSIEEGMQRLISLLDDWITYEHTHLQNFPSVFANALYVCHILGRSVCLNPPDNQYLHDMLQHCSSRHSLPCLICLTDYCKAALDLLYRALIRPQRQKPFKIVTQMLFKT